MSILTINNSEKPSIVYQEITREEIIEGCSSSFLHFSLSGNGTFPLSMISNIEPGGGSVTLSTTKRIINHNGSMVSYVGFSTGFTGLDGGSHSQQDNMFITLNGIETFTIDVTASEICMDLKTNSQMVLSCWDGGSGVPSSSRASVSLESNGNLLSSLLNVKKLSPCDGISAQ